MVSHEGLERLLAQVGNGTAAASLRPCLGTALQSAADALTVSVQSCLLRHNIVGKHRHGTLPATWHPARHLRVHIAHLQASSCGAPCTGNLTMFTMSSRQPQMYDEPL